MARNELFKLSRYPSETLPNEGLTETEIKSSIAQSRGGTPTTYQARLDKPNIIETQQSAEDFWHERGVTINKSEPLDEHSYVSRALESISGRAKIKRREVAVWRAAEEARANITGPRFLIFDTLTLHDMVEAKQRFTQGWHQYKKAVIRAVNKALGRPRDAPGSDCRHLAAIEEGDQYGRPHMHVLWSLPQIPQSWYPDPNRYHRAPLKREIDAMKSLWSHGISSPIALRIGPADAWATRAGWCWPLGKDGLPLMANPGTVGGYIGKYLNKQKRTR